MKVGDEVVWEIWAGPQVITRIYFLRDGQPTEGPPDPGALVFADLEPLSSAGKWIGHAVYLDDLTPLKELIP